MNMARLTKWSLVAALIAGPQAALACGEMMVNAGRGLALQGYLAPRPANVLILYTDASHDREYAGLEQAGHHLTLVADAEQLAQELAQNSYDIVIAAFDMVDTVTQEGAVGGSVQVLPIVARSMRRSAEVRARFDQFLVDGSGVRQFLAVINRALAS